MIACEVGEGDGLVLEIGLTEEWRQSFCSGGSTDLEVHRTGREIWGDGSACMSRSALAAVSARNASGYRAA
ncbi:hypothetical protein [Rhodopirellula baltica]|uniref:hypothetical protein n=1 Tax=Rhodopirellula baltica TaxID=265606 RepID=UPI00030C625A|nr:hypothetical protein [Rhodopirellula baltica]